MLRPRDNYKKAKLEYWKFPEEGYPKKIWWKVHAGNRKLGILEEYDLVFNSLDARYLTAL